MGSPVKSPLKNAEPGSIDLVILREQTEGLFASAQTGIVLHDQIATNLPKTACDIRTAYFVIQGQDDVITPTQAAVEYFKCVKAPKKELILIPNAGHFAFMTASDKFLEALTSKVRPVAIARGA